MATFDSELNKLKRHLFRIPSELGAEAVNFFESRITTSTNVNGQPLKKRAFDPQNRKGARTLIKSGNLRRAIRVASASMASIKIENRLPYAEIHNEGGQIPITPKMRKFFWAQHYKATVKTKTRTGRNSKSKKAKAAGADAAFWKNMALKKGPVQIPQRQFMGSSPLLKKQLAKAAENHLKRFKA